MMPSEDRWWKDGILYQVYPRSFQDGDGDGIGDLAGVTKRLDHLAWLGVDAIWLNPIHPSPNRDWGYDVADYLDVAPDLGGMAALDRLIGEASRRRIRVILDLVPNHTSDRHPWFVDARRGRNTEHRDWYVWADPSPDGGPPNNWRSTFGGPAWSLDQPSGQYFLHSFLPQQPDLNWWNDEVREEFDRILRFWFDRGVAGFRIDVANAIVKDRRLRDDPIAAAPGTVATGEPPEVFSMHRPEVHDVLRRWRRIADSYEPQRVLIGETWARDLADLARYYGEGEELHLAFNFAFATATFEAPALRAVIEATGVALGDDAWPLWTASNHDIGRLATHWADGDDARVRCALFLLLMLRGTPVLYAGDEIGLPDVDVPPSRRRDEGTRADGRSRDGGRTPIPWSSGPGRGFTAPGVDAWLPLGPAATSVEDQRRDPGSVLHWCRRVIRLRADLDGGGPQRLLVAPDDVLAWRLGSRTAVAVNLANEPVSVDLAGHVVLASDASREGRAFDGQLERWGCVVVEMVVEPPTSYRDGRADDPYARPLSPGDPSADPPIRRSISR